MKKILFVTLCLNYGGAEKMLCFIAESLQKRGYDVHIANLQAIPKTSEYMRDITVSVPVHDASSAIPSDSFWRRRLSRIDNIIKLKKIAKEINADILIGFNILPNYLSRIVGFLLGKPTIMSERGDPKRIFGSGILDTLRVKIINTCEGGVFQTFGAMDFYGEKLKSKATVIYNSINLKEDEQITDFDKRKNAIVSLGRFQNIQKRYDVLLKAFSLFSEKHPDYRHKFYGSGPDEGMIKELCERLNISDKVDFMGVTKHSLEELSDYQIHCLKQWRLEMPAFRQIILQVAGDSSVF